MLRLLVLKQNCFEPSKEVTCGFVMKKVVAYQDLDGWFPHEVGEK